jgi:hypothetical protein
MDPIQILSGVAITLSGSGIIWFIRTISKTRNEVDILFVKFRHLEDQLKEVKDAIKKRF